MTTEQQDIVRRITLSHLSGVPKDADWDEIDMRRSTIHCDMFEHERLEDVSAADLCDESDQVISENGWRL